MPSVTEAGIERLFRKWQPRLGLGEWKIELFFESDIATEEGAEAVAACKCVDNYQLARIKVDLAALLDPDQIGSTDLDEEIEATVVHELLHCCVRDMRRANETAKTETMLLHRPYFGQAEERVVDKLARALVRAWKESA